MKTQSLPIALTTTANPLQSGDMAHPDGGEPEVEVELTDGDWVGGSGASFKMCKIKATYNSEIYVTQIHRILGEGSKAKLCSQAYEMKDAGHIKRELPIADAPKWFKKVLKMYYPMAKIGVS